jgi:exodeoxyribonuclease VII small subunit
MSDERSTFEMTRARLEDIVTQARRKDVSLEQSLDLLEEAVRLVNQCNELIDQTSFRAPEAGTEAGGVDESEVTVTDVIEVVDLDGDGIADVLVETLVLSEDVGTEDAETGESGTPPEEEDDERE